MKYIDDFYLMYKMSLQPLPQSGRGFFLLCTS